MKQTLMVGFSGILDIGQVEDQKMIKDKLIDGKKLLADLKVKLLSIINKTKKL